jgi:hypothetical protein
LAQSDTITDTTTSTSTKNGSQIVVTPQSTTQTIGNAVSDVTFNPYIAKRIISFYAYNLRPNTLLHVFFDGVLVDKYCAPGVAPSGVIADSADYNSVHKTGNWGDAITTDAFGTIAGQFNIPEATFKFGDRVLTLADTTNLTTTQNAITTQASGTFTASNLTVTKEAITLTSITPQISYIPVSCTVVTSVSTTNIIVHPDNVTLVGTAYEPIAQGLTINTPNGEAGIFATSIDIFFAQKDKHGKSGVSVYLCEINNGYPDGKKVLPHSLVHLPWSNVAINTGTGSAVYNSAGPSANDAVQYPTNFKFESPIFLNNGVEYAFIVKPDNGEPDYWVYSATLGYPDFVLTTPVSSQPVQGTAFYGATDRQWTALQNEYIKFNLYRAEFSAQTGDAYFYNDSSDFVKVYNVGYACTTYDILPGDYVYQSKNSYSNATGGTVNTSIKGIVTTYDDVNQTVYIANSTGNWPTSANNLQIHRFANADVAATPGPNNLTQIAYANTSGLYDLRINAVVPSVASVVPAGTSLNLSYKGTNNTYVLDTQEFKVNSGTETDFYDYERLLVSKSNEVVSMSSNKSFKLHANLVTTSSLLSPLIDGSRYTEKIIANNVDPVSLIYEEFFNDGPSKTKYISKIVTLAPGQDAQDINVVVTAWRPPGTDIQVWVKFLNGQDGDPISAKTWTPLINGSGTLFSSPSDPAQYNEYSFFIPSYYTMLTTSGTITATASCTAITGVNTKFQTELNPGWFINMAATSTTNETVRKVISIASNTSLTLDQGFNYSYSGNAYFLVPPPTTPWMASTTTTQINGLVTTSTTNNSIIGYGASITANTVGVNNSANAILITNANTYYSTGQRVYYYVPAGNTALTGLTGNSYYYIATTNTSTVTLNPQAGNTTPITITAPTTNPAQVHSLNTTFFDIQVKLGNIIKVSDNPQTVVSVSNGTYMTVGKPALTAASYANAYLSTPNGLSYLNSNAALYSTFIKFQFKVILQSNDSSKPPMISNIRAMALQL